MDHGSDVEVAVENVFAGLAGEPGGDPGAGGIDLGRLEAALEGAAVWGLELDPRFRVLAATFEPTPQRYAWGPAEDRRVQLLCFPVSTILGSLRRESRDDKQLLAFIEEQLVDIVGMFDGATVSGPLFGQPEPRPGVWGPRYSLEGRSSAPDGVSSTFTLSLRHDDLSLDLFARFDEVQIKGPDGAELVLEGPG